MILQDLSNLTPDELGRLLSRCDEHTAQGLLSVLQDEIRTRCGTDGLYWLRFVSTRDEADPDNPVKLFPVHLPYLGAVWTAFGERNRTIAVKSRQIMFSWLLTAYMCHWARSKPNQAIYYQTQKAEDADAMVALAGNVEGRCQFIESHLPDFLRVKVRATQGSLQFPNGSFIQALAGGADQIRGKVASLIVQDEFAFQPEARGVYTACAPLIQKGAKFIAVSTPNGISGEFARLWHGSEKPLVG